MIGETREVQLLEEILQELKNISYELMISNLQQKEIAGLITQLLPEPAVRTEKITIKFGGNMPGTPGTVEVGQTIVASLVALEADGTTPTPGAVGSAQGYAIDNPALASFVVNADGTATFTGLAPGTANVTGTETVTDSDGVAASFTSPGVVLTVTPKPVQTASIELNFAAPLTPSISKK